MNAFDVTTPAGVAALFDASIDTVHRAAMRWCGGSRPLAEDLTQQTYRDLLVAVEAGKVASVDVGWLITVVRRRAIDAGRAERREAGRVDRLTAHRWGTEPPEPDWSVVEADQMRRALHRLVPHERIALVLRHVDDWAVPAIAVELGRSVHATESVLARARTNLRRLIRADEEGER